MGPGDTHGSGECMGEDAWRMYCVHWKTRKARLARKSRADSRPATGRSWKPVLSETAYTICARCTAHRLCRCSQHWKLWEGLLLCQA